MLDDASKLQFLWSKWSHHDGLLHARPNRFWALQTVLVAVIAFLVESKAAEPFGLALCSVSLAVSAYFGLRIVRMMEVDRLCRNSFNGQIVEILSDRNPFVILRPQWRSLSVHLSDAENRDIWHAAGTELPPSAVVTTIKSERLILAASAFEAMLALALLAFWLALETGFLDELRRHLELYS